MYWGNELTHTSQWTLPLPEGWVEAVDAPTGQPCYLHEPSGVVQLAYPSWDPTSPLALVPGPGLVLVPGAVGAGRGQPYNAQQLRQQQQQLQQQQQRQLARGGPVQPSSTTTRTGTPLHSSHYFPLITSYSN